MSADTEEKENMTKINVRVPQKILDTIDEEYKKRGYTSRSEAIRDALRAWIDPPIRLTEETLKDLQKSKKQKQQGKTKTLDEVADKYGVDLETNE